MRDVTRLVVWRRSIDLSGEVANAIPIRAGHKSPGLRGQAIRSASGIPEAIAEGCGKSSEREFARYLEIAAGSATELQTQLVLAKRHGILDAARFKNFWREASELRRMLIVFQRKVRERAEGEAMRRSRPPIPQPAEILKPEPSPLTPTAKRQISAQHE